MALIIAAPFINMRWNDWKLQHFARQMERLGHPPGTQLVQAVQFLGIAGGTGNHCDFLVAQLRSYSGDEKQIRAFYRTAKVQAPNGETIPVEVAVWKDARFDDESFGWLNEVNSWFSPHLLKNQKVYAVSISAGGYAPCLDIRCH